MTIEIDVLATASGWRVAAGDKRTEFEALAAALEQARRLAGLARWRGQDACIMAQDRIGGELKPLRSDPDKA